MGAFNLWRTSPSPNVLLKPLTLPSREEEYYIPLNHQNVIGAAPPLAIKQVTSGLRPTLYQFRNNDDDSLTVTWDVPQDADLTKKARVFLTYIPEDGGEIDFVIRIRGFSNGDPVGAGESNTQFNFSHTPTGDDECQTRVDITEVTQQILLNPIELIFFQIVRDGVGDANSGIVYPISLSILYFMKGEVII